MTKIESIIIDYCKEEKPKYALLIDGKWGEGKTHFLKNNIATKINENSSVEYLFIYISLNGIEDTKSITDEIISKLLFPTESDTGKIVSSVLISSFETLKNKVGLSNAKLKLTDTIKLDNTILCFDDLERISSKLQIEDVLGYINTNFVEHNNVNTIIVCDKSKIKESVDKEKSFDIIKEKVIGRTIKFEYSINEVLNIFKEEMNKDNSGFLNKYETTFNVFFHQTQTKNLRTVFFIIDNFKRIIPCINGNTHEETIYLLINFTLIISTEFKRGEFYRTKDFYKTSRDFDHLLVLDNLLNDNSKKNDISNSEEIKKDDFNELYKGIHFSYVDSVYNFVENGFFNATNIESEISDLNSNILNKRVKPEYALLKELQNWRNYKEDDFNKLVEKLKFYFENNKYTLYTIVDTLTYWCSFVQSKLIENFQIMNLEDLDEYLSIIISSLPFKDEENQTIHQLYLFDRENRYPLPKTHIAISQKIIEFNRIAYSDKFKHDLKNIKEDIRLLNGINEHDPFKYLLDNMTIKELSELTIYFLEKDNKFFQIYEYKLRKTFSYSNAGEQNYKYKEKIDNLLLELDKIDSIEDKIERYLLKDFINLLKLKSQHLENTR